MDVIGENGKKKGNTHQQHIFNQSSENEKNLKRREQYHVANCSSWCSTSSTSTSSSSHEEHHESDLDKNQGPSIFKIKPQQHRTTNNLFTSSSSKPVATTTTTSTLISPHEYLLNMTKAKPRSSLDIQNYFHKFSPKDLENYTKEAIEAVRNFDMDKIRSMHKEGKSFQCSNAFGESLLHMACRHGFFEIVHFFIFEANVNIQCRDDVGRTPLHDACWSSEPNFQLIELIISMSPSLLLMKDKRGHAPLEYTRREHWSNWISFLDRQKDKIEKVNESMEHEHCQDGER